MSPQSYALNVLAGYAERLKLLNEGKSFNKPQQKVIRAVFQDEFKRVFIRKGRKGGGTESIIYLAARFAGTFPNTATYIIGPTLTLQREILWNNNRLRHSVPRHWISRVREAESRIIFDNGSFIKVHGADNHAALAGIEGDLFIFDELKDHDPRAYKNCYPNIASRDAYWVVLGSPPKNKNNFYFKLEQQVKNDKDWFFIHWSTWDNAEFLPGGVAWIQNEKERYYRNGEWDDWESEYEARYVFGGRRQVLPHFDSERHVLPHDVLMSMLSKDLHKLDWFVGFDPGYATCFAVLVAAINRYTSEIFFLDEIYETDRTKTAINEIWPRTQKLLEQFPSSLQWKRIYDSAATGFPTEIRSRYGRIPFMPSYKQKGDEDTYFRILNSVFYTNRAYVSERCPGLINEVENYLLEESGAYPDRDNHQLDNVRYILKMSGYKMAEKREETKVVIPTMRGLVDEDTIEQRKNIRAYEYYEDFQDIDIW